MGLRLRDLDVAGEVHHGVGARQDTIEQRCVTDVTDHERGPGIDARTWAFLQSVQHSHFVAGAQQTANGDRADVAGAAGDKQLHGMCPSPRDDPRGQSSIGLFRGMMARS